MRGCGMLFKTMNIREKIREAENNQMLKIIKSICVQCCRNKNEKRKY